MSYFDVGHGLIPEVKNKNKYAIKLIDDYCRITYIKVVSFNFFNSLDGFLTIFTKIVCLSFWDIITSSSYNLLLLIEKINKNYSYTRNSFYIFFWYITFKYWYIINIWKLFHNKASVCNIIDNVSTIFIFSIFNF